MNIAIIGSRDFADYLLLKNTINKYLEDNNLTHKDIQYIVSGGARGADRYGEQYGKEYGIDLKIYLPEWDKYDKAAGYIRNKQIVEDSDIIFAFWDGESKGTKHSIDLAPKMKKKIIVTKFEKKNPISESSISILQKLLSKIKN